MKESVLAGKRILLVDDKPEVSAVLQKEILESAPECRVETVNSHREAVERMMSYTYDAVILDGTAAWDLDLLSWAHVRNFPVGMLTTPSLKPEPLEQATKMAPRFYLPKKKLAEIVPFLEDIMWYEHSPWWGRLAAAHIGSNVTTKLINIILGFFSHSLFSKVQNLNVSLCTLLPAPVSAEGRVNGRAEYFGGARGFE